MGSTDNDMYKFKYYTTNSFLYTYYSRMILNMIGSMLNVFETTTVISNHTKHYI